MFHYHSMLVTGFKLGSNGIYTAKNAMLDLLGLAEPAQLCNVWKIKVNFQHRTLKDVLQ
jgi:hypothetical protein